MQCFLDRREAGKALAHLLEDRTDLDRPLILALPRGGVPVAYEIAKHLNAPLDIFIVRKLGVPGHEEVAMGAIASGGIQVLNEGVIRALSIDRDMVSNVAVHEGRELRRRELTYRNNLPPLEISGRTVILVDDGLATGSTIRAAVLSLRRSKPEKILVAVPVGAADVCRELRSEVDEVICARTPHPFHAVGSHYEDFSQVNDAAVCALLAHSPRRERAA